MKTTRIERQATIASYTYACEECGQEFKVDRDCKRHEIKHKAARIPHDEAADAYYLRTREEADTVAHLHYAYYGRSLNHSGWYTLDFGNEDNYGRAMFLIPLYEAISNAESEIERLRARLAALKKLDI